ncbi:IclR family transcriptional regulator [Bradyrhizobium canariense]|uniref:Transcriptional regulator, IclR family n=1 Tax=Bradyrhizobium canariense TaxID=255045 RepID=A0A1H1WJ17_9BRAD|nr:helix-turn-helix domain-containing protein [Bradyrhizobium canariense]SDS96306.1 transcriptional regulator, IclR family [Bradyrhizobium canariense]
MSNELTKSARRVFDILELFRERQCPLRLKDVVDALGMPTSSAAALLKTMAQLNYLSFESTSRAYLPTLRLSQLGGWVTSENYETGPVQEAVRRIGRKVGETILLGTVTDIYVEIVDIIRARQPLQYYTMVGTKVLLVHSGVGWPLLSEETDQDIARIYRRTVKLKKIERGVSSLDRLKAGIEKVRRDGYCLSRGMVTRGVGVIGMMMPTPPTHRRLAIGVAGPQERIEKNLTKILAALRAESARLSHFSGAID